MASGGDTSFTLAVATEAGAAEQLNQIIAAWVATTDRGVPLELVEVEHATKYALDVRNKETTSSLVARFRNAAGENLLTLVKEAVTIGKPLTCSGTVTFSDAVTFAAGQSITADLIGDVTGDVTGNADTATDADTVDGSHAAAFAPAAKGVTNGDSHDHAGGDGAQIAHTGLSSIGTKTHAEIDAHLAATTGIHGAVSAQTASKVVIRDASGRARFADPSNAQDAATKAYADAIGAAGEGVTGGDAHDHSGGDGAEIPIGGLAFDPATQTELNSHKSSGDHDGRYFTETQSDARFAPIAKGVTGGNSHDHAGGDGAQIPLAGHANNSIDDTKVGNRVPALIRRQGGSATDWNAMGSTNRTPTTVRMQAGSVGDTYSVPGSSGDTYTVTFPVAFSAKPLVFATIHKDYHADVKVISVSATQCQIKWEEVLYADHISATTLSMTIHWLAIGPE